MGSPPFSRSPTEPSYIKGGVFSAAEIAFIYPFSRGEVAGWGLCVSGAEGKTWCEST
jgi:hypothetical protein